MSPTTEERILLKLDELQEWQTEREVLEKEHHMRLTVLENSQKEHFEFHKNDQAYKRGLNTKLWLTLLGVAITLATTLITMLIKSAL